MESEPVLAVAISNPSTSDASTETIPVPSRTTSCVSFVRCGSGRSRAMLSPNSAPEKVHAVTRTPTTSGVMPLCYTGRGCRHTVLCLLQSLETLVSRDVAYTHSLTFDPQARLQPSERQKR